jgi:truncated hemoglobin YjbI
VGKVVKIFLTYNSTMSESQKIPTLYEWAGGMATFEKLMDVFYKKVLEDFESRKLHLLFFRTAMTFDY